MVDEYYPLVDKISNELNTLEESLLTSQQKEEETIKATIYRLEQNLIALRQMIAPEREVLSSVIGEERLAGSNENRDLFRHLYERLMRRVYDVVDASVIYPVMCLIYYKTASRRNLVKRLIA